MSLYESLVEVRYIRCCESHQMGNAVRKDEAHRQHCSPMSMQVALARLLGVKVFVCLGSLAHPLAPAILNG